MEPILVLLPGIIMDHKVDLESLEAHGRTTVKAELFYNADRLREVESAYTDLSPHLAIEPGIIPLPSEDKRKRVKLLNHRLGGRKADYPVQIMPVRARAPVQEYSNAHTFTCMRNWRTASAREIRKIQESFENDVLLGSRGWARAGGRVYA